VTKQLQHYTGLKSEAAPTTEPGHFTCSPLCTATNENSACGAKTLHMALRPGYNIGHSCMVVTYRVRCYGNTCVCMFTSPPDTGNQNQIANENSVSHWHPPTLVKESPSPIVTHPSNTVWTCGSRTSDKKTSDMLHCH